MLCLQGKKGLLIIEKAIVSSCLTLLQKRYGCQSAAINKNTHSDDYPVLLWEV